MTHPAGTARTRVIVADDPESGAQVLIRLHPEEVHVATRPNSWSSWGPPLRIGVDEYEGEVVDFTDRRRMQLLAESIEQVERGKVE